MGLSLPFLPSQGLSSLAGLGVQVFSFLIGLLLGDRHAEEQVSECMVSLCLRVSRGGDLFQS